MTIETASTLTCPECGHASVETMPSDCGVLLKPKAGHCCVFCSYGSVPCPSMQESRLTGASGR